MAINGLQTSVKVNRLWHTSKSISSPDYTDNTVY